MPEDQAVSPEKIIVRKYKPGDDTPLLQLIELQIADSNTWPSESIRKNWDLLEWMALHSSLSRWVAVGAEGALVGHIGTSAVPAGARAEYWSTLIDIDPARLAEVSRLLVSPLYQRSGISGLITRRCIRATIEGGRVPVATSNPSSSGSLKMMLKFGWRVEGRLYSDIAKRDLVYLLPPQKLIDAALDNPLASASRDCRFSDNSAST